MTWAPGTVSPAWERSEGQDWESRTGLGSDRCPLEGEGEASGGRAPEQKGGGGRLNSVMKTLVNLKV